MLRPLKVVIDNYPEGQVEELEAVNNPEDAAAGHAQGAVLARALHRAGRLPRGCRRRSIFRLSPGQEVRLRYAYFVTCTGVVKDATTGEVVEVHCTYDPATRGGNAPDGRKVKATIHWVSAAHAVDAEVRLYDHLFTKREPERRARGPGLHRQPESELAGSADRLPSSSRALASAAPGSRFQFERLGYFCVDPDSTPGKPVFNRTVTLRDTWAKIEKREKGGK